MLQNRTITCSTMNLSREDDYMADSDSDQGCIGSDSSDDAIDIILNGTPQQKRHLRRRSLGHHSDSSSDEFEKEMEAQLTATVHDIHRQQGCGSSTQALKCPIKRHAKSEKKFYSNEYFDSDSDDEATSTEKKQHLHSEVSNDDLLYDPKMDAADQQWVNKQRNKYCLQQSDVPKHKKKGDVGETSNAPGSGRLPNSDAVLNCPACMSTLCRDCQRHEKFHHQYRAMFVSDCKVNMDEILRMPENSSNKRRNKKYLHTPARSTVTAKSHEENIAPVVATESGDADKTPAMLCMESEGVFHPVHCMHCNTEVGVYDSDEVYHFFNVLTSH